MIPLDRIAAVSLVRSHLGETRFTDLLHVRWRAEAGEDPIAWRVPDPVEDEARVASQLGADDVSAAHAQVASGVRARRRMSRKVWVRRRAPSRKTGSRRSCVALARGTVR